jgi:tryptophanyl-tRNA synthetase
MTRTIVRRFNARFCKEESVFVEPEPLLSEAPLILGLDGTQKMSKSRNNAVMLKATEDETATLIKKAKTDSERLITYDPDNRPEIANLLRLISLSTQRDPAQIADEIGDQGAGKLKQMVIDSLNEYLKPIRAKRKEIENDSAYIHEVLNKGIQRARHEAEITLNAVRAAMNMNMNF